MKIIIEIIKNYKLSQQRRIMRGYRHLKKNGEINKIRKIQEILTSLNLGISKKNYSKYIVGENFDYIEIALRQYLLVRIGGIKLNKSLLCALGVPAGKVIHPLPKIWREVLKDNGFFVDDFKSSLLWSLYNFALFVYGIVTILKIIFLSFLEIFKKNNFNKNSTFFVNLSVANLPNTNLKEKSYDVISWYLNKKRIGHGDINIYHTVKNHSLKLKKNTYIEFQPNPLLPIDSLNGILSFLFWCFYSICVVSFDFIRTRWWSVVIFNQLVLSKQARCSNNFSQEYLFHNSNYIYRPLWTYDLENRGSKIYLYFYSTNTESLKIKNNNHKLPAVSDGWKSMSWPNYLVWDRFQAAFISTQVNNYKNIEIVGPIWFEDSKFDFPEINSDTIAVFDITPYRRSRYVTLGLDYEYYIPSVTNKFLKEIKDLAKKHKVVILHKRKRDTSKLTHPLYRSFLNKFYEDNCTIDINPMTSPIQIIKKSTVVVSMPFTSTAKIAQKLGKPSIYFDPSGKLKKNHFAAQGIPVLKSVKELDSWMTKYFRINKSIGVS